jgi:hypothetical protein
MFCETDREKALFNLLTEQYPDRNAYLLELMAWVYINRPDKFESIMSAHKEGDMNLIELKDFDINSINTNTHNLEQIEE